jgi:hypothetical protein
LKIFTKPFFSYCSIEPALLLLKGFFSNEIFFLKKKFLQRFSSELDAASMGRKFD